ncbi:GPO family capsid scaffolding protein [Oceanisphaera arctica]|uniref:Capsid protein n=1 Tax=Oceanisphaera arctica TaxID=641510 RepID=A0A2P5TMT5_9GAMM|nr:GPO family capsid scaffolding protein [Oceanisphaera arctica]PPL16802.1 capsid protein [Oceanisphaera arctica]GHA05651.1 hypothetical protein GCM10007082_03280 [Oceanisphaera arctica]
MSTDSKLRTGWVCIATEGNSVDERVISREWLTDMAETYDPDHYTAVIWPDHYKWSAMGTVEALKAEEVDGKMKLFAILRPTRELIYQNQQGQYQFCSIEPKEQFAGSEKTYLAGLGVTDRPASTGTTRMQFSAKDQPPKVIGQSEPFSLADMADREQEAGMFKKFMTWFKAQEPDTPAPQIPEPEEPMDKAQFSELLTAVNSVADKQGELEAKFEQFSKKEPEPAPAPAITPDPPPVPAETGVTAEQFSELMTAVKGMTDKQGGLEIQFSTLLKEKPGQTPNPAPAGGDIYHVV